MSGSATLATARFRLATAATRMSASSTRPARAGPTSRDAGSRVTVSCVSAPEGIDHVADVVEIRVGTDDLSHAVAVEFDTDIRRHCREHETDSALVQRPGQLDQRR